MGSIALSASLLSASLLSASLLSASLEAQGGDADHGRGRGDGIHQAQLRPAESMSGHLSPASTIGALLRHQAFAGFARLLLPWDDRAYDEGLPLALIGSLLPFHSHVDPDGVVRALNRMVDDAGSGQRIFIDIYSDAQKQGDPAKRQAGLFFFRGKPGAAFAVIAPGGGFAYVGSVHEGFPTAAAISAAGYNAFVLKYRSGLGGRAPTEDLAAAITVIVRDADRLGVGTAHYSLWGSSAGARMAAAIGSHGVAAFGGGNVPKPAAVMLAYTAHADHSTDEPPTFAVVGEDDAIAPPAIMQRRIDALRRIGTAVELRRYGNVGHGFGVGTGTSAEGWIADAVRFWEGVVNARRLR